MSERQIKCPQCGLLTVYKQENSFRPFCSERCKLIDLGEWATENYRIPTKESAQIYQDSNNDQNESEDPEA
jgi:uncharacterized protein